jgi:hypothetical protein
MKAEQIVAVLCASAPLRQNVSLLEAKSPPLAAGIGHKPKV